MAAVTIGTSALASWIQETVEARKMTAIRSPKCGLLFMMSAHKPRLCRYLNVILHDEAGFLNWLQTGILTSSLCDLAHD